ncbi:MAG: hypothetical protein KCHDKBKB_02391 [Elusimicrobia bacterium]|nr:hypothetical protein [Elusimicrobiota bacterium]
MSLTQAGTEPATTLQGPGSVDVEATIQPKLGASPVSVKSPLVTLKPAPSHQFPPPSGLRWTATLTLRRPDIRAVATSPAVPDIVVSVLSKGALGSCKTVVGTLESQIKVCVVEGDKLPAKSMV